MTDGRTPEAPLDEFRCDVFSADQLARLASSPLPLGIPAGRVARTFHRDVYLDTPDGALRRRGVVCRLRIRADDRRTLSLRAHDAQGAPGATGSNGARGARGAHGTPGAHGAPPLRVEAAVRATEPVAALAEDTPVRRRLCALVDPARLEVRATLEVERVVRGALPDWLRRPRLELHYDQVTVRREGAARSFQQLCVHRLRGRGDEVRRLADAFQREHGLRLLTTGRRERAELLLKWMQTAEPAVPGAGSDAEHPVPGWERPAGGADVLDPELSLLAFQERVLALAEDAATPLAERLRFLSIVSANLDEFHTVRVAGLKAAAQELTEEQGDEGMDRRVRLDAIAGRVAALVARQYRCYHACLGALAAHGVHVRAWHELDEAQRAALRERFREEIAPELTPLAMTLSPGHPFPRLPHLSLSIAAVLVDRDRGAPHFTEVELPPDVPRLLRVDAAAGDGAARHDVVPVEEVVRANLDVLYPMSRVEQAHLFRVTRGADLHLDEGQTEDLLEAVAAASGRRGQNAVVRVEVERAMPAVLRDLVLEELRAEGGAQGPQLGPNDVHEIDGPLDLRLLDDLPLPPLPGLEYPPFEARRPVPADRRILDVVRGGDLLVHHPFDSFADTVVRFLREAAADPDVAAIKITLYRVGDHSPVIDALRKAAKRGKRVVAFVELKARFEEERNVGWVRALADAGVRVVYGLVGLKTHAKAALVVRREGGKLRRYAHVSTGNYNARAGRHYTDLGLFSADEALTADVADLFNALTGSSGRPPRLARGALVAPEQLLPALLDAIEQEAAHARAGRPARIRIKANGLSDGEVVRALYRASGDGVPVELAVRGICTLRPGVPGLSERIRVVATIGRFLEHSRIYHFANGGQPRWYIGSADLRPRNLRRRVELLVPVHDAGCRATLDRLLDLYLADARGWELTAGGWYVRRPGRLGAQDALLAELADVEAVAAEAPGD